MIIDAQQLPLFTRVNSHMGYCAPNESPLFFPRHAEIVIDGAA
jgi:hypothetical protein